MRLITPNVFDQIQTEKSKGGVLMCLQVQIDDELIWQAVGCRLLELVHWFLVEYLEVFVGLNLSDYWSINN